MIWVRTRLGVGGSLPLRSHLLIGLFLSGTRAFFYALRNFPKLSSLTRRVCLTFVCCCAWTAKKRLTCSSGHVSSCPFLCVFFPASGRSLRPDTYSRHAVILPPPNPVCPLVLLPPLALVFNVVSLLFLSRVHAFLVPRDLLILLLVGRGVGALLCVFCVGLVATGVSLCLLCVCACLFFVIIRVYRDYREINAKTSG